MLQSTTMSFSDHFSIRNIPYGIATSSSHPQRAVVTRIHDHVFFLSDLPVQASEDIRQAFAQVRFGNRGRGVAEGRKADMADNP